MRRRRFPLAAAWLLLVLLVPAVGWAFGARQPVLENRPKAELPDLNRGTLKQQETFKQIDTFILDRLPLRKEAVEANARVNVRLFRDSPNPDVALGEDGWLYYARELRACRDAPPATDPADAAEILARTLLASGRRAVVTVVGSKFSIHPQDAPEVDADAQRCVAQLERRVRARLAATPGGLDIDTGLLAQERRGRATFLQRDTHWNARGRLHAARTILDAIRPGLADAAQVAAGETIDRKADLPALMGYQESDRDRVVVARRTPKDPPRNVVLVGDSQLEFALLNPPGNGAPPVVQRALPGALTCHFEYLGNGECDAALEGARTVVVETVGRNLDVLGDVCWRPVLTAARGLRGRATDYEILGGSGDPHVKGFTLLPQTPVRLRVRARDRTRDSAPVARLILIPVTRGAVGMVQQAERGLPAPCATPAADAAGGVLVLPVPAGRRVSDLVVQLTAPEGGSVGRPREVALTDTRPRR